MLDSTNFWYLVVFMPAVMSVSYNCIFKAAKSRCSLITWCVSLPNVLFTWKKLKIIYIYKIRSSMNVFDWEKILVSKWCAEAVSARSPTVAWWTSWWVGTLLTAHRSSTMMKSWLLQTGYSGVVSGGRRGESVPLDPRNTLLCLVTHHSSQSLSTDAETSKADFN